MSDTGGVRWTGRRRMAAAMAKQDPDRVPVMCQLAAGHYFLNTPYDPIDIWHDSEAFARALCDLARRYRFDGILVNLPGRDPQWRDSIDSIEEHGTERWVVWKDGSVSKVPRDDNVHYFPSREGERVFPVLDDVEPELLWYAEPHDTTGISYPCRWGFSDEPADPASFFPDYYFDSLDRVRELAGDEFSVHSEVFSPFSQFMEFFDLSSGLMSLIENPATTHAILNRFTEGAIELGSLQAERDVDAVLISDAFAGGGFISRDMYEEFVLPYNRRVVEGIKASRPLPVYVHTCGAIGDRLDLLERTAVDGIDTFDPPPLGNVEIQEAVERLGKRLFIKGNLDAVNTLLHGTPDEVAAAARERIQIAGPGGAYILSSACSVAPHVPPEHIMLLHEAAETCGTYPIL